MEALDTTVKTNMENMQRVFWKRKLVSSIPANLAWRPWPPFPFTSVSAMFLVNIYSCSV